MDRRPTLPSWKRPQDFQESQDGTASHFSDSQGSHPAFEQNAIHFLSLEGIRTPGSGDVLFKPSRSACPPPRPRWRHAGRRRPGSWMRFSYI